MKRFVQTVASDADQFPVLLRGAEGDSAAATTVRPPPAALYLNIERSQVTLSPTVSFFLNSFRWHSTWLVRRAQRARACRRT